MTDMVASKKNHRNTENFITSIFYKYKLEARLNISKGCHFVHQF